MSEVEHHDGISRRTLVKSTAIGSLALAAGGIALPFGLKSAAAAVQTAIQPAEDKVVWGACSVNCGSRCALRLHVRDDEVYWVETDNTGEDVYGNHQVRACLRGRSIRRRINHPDRLNYPMKRVGKRGEGKFERITREEALDTIAASLKSVVEKYGNEAVYINYSSGIVGGNITRSSPYASLVARLMNCYGGFLSHYSTAQIACAMPYTYGSNDGNSTSDIENTKLVVMFGNNPAETRMSGGGITYYLEQARERSNARMIVIDPRYTDTAAGREDEWIPIRPGTDAALVAGIAWVLINENLVDQPFLDKYCVGYDEKPCRKAHLLMVITKPIFSAVVMTKPRKLRSGRRALQAFLPIALLSWPVKSVRQNRPTFAGVGARSVRPTASRHPAPSPCCRS